MTQQTADQNNRKHPEVINVKRNPYLVEYEEQRRAGKSMGSRFTGGRYEVSRVTGNERKRAACRADRRARRRKIVRRQRIAVGAWMLCILAMSVTLLSKKVGAFAADHEDRPDSVEWNQDAVVRPEPAAIQGLPAEIYNRHPKWTEDFLTPNEYSRPGDALEQVTNIFVHYTANPGTSAAQNRSYFEQQKDTHERSVSSHFIIGYEGEIIQCVPLDEVAYAVQTRNMDSISIECCFVAKDGSFTQETYNSLISLLAWLTDAYDLDTDDILRHYDCGGKKCPLYYTEHPDKWEQLKEDVASYIS